MMTRHVLIVGVSGFVGRHVAQACLDEGCRVRGLTRDPERAAAALDRQVELYTGDMLDPDAVARAAEGMNAVVFCAHTISAQPGGRPGAGFMEIEHAGMRNVIAACRAAGVRRVIAVTSLGVASDASSDWLRGRYELEQTLLASGCDATVFRPGMIVGSGGQGFDAVVAAARRRVATTLYPRGRRVRPIAVTDLARYIVQAIDEPRSHGEVFDVGTDDTLTIEELTGLVADALGGQPPRVLHLPRRLLRLLAPVLERRNHLPSGAAAGMLDGVRVHLTGDPHPGWELFGPPTLDTHDAIAQALAEAGPRREAASESRVS